MKVFAYIATFYICIWVYVYMYVDCGLRGRRGLRGPPRRCFLSLHHPASIHASGSPVAPSRTCRLFPRRELTFASSFLFLSIALILNASRFNHHLLLLSITLCHSFSPLTENSLHRCAHVCNQTGGYLFIFGYFCLLRGHQYIFFYLYAIARKEILLRGFFT